MYDVIAIGEILIDFTPAGPGPNGSTVFACNPGGAPANVLAANSRLGGKTAFIGKVGNDGFGRFLSETLESSKIDTCGLIMTDEAPTTLAFVHLDSRGDRSFSFYRSQSADIMLNFEEVDQELINNTRIFHFGSVSLTGEPSRTATMESVRIAKKSGAIISYDPNYRPPLWRSHQEAAEQMRAALPFADIIKVSDEELSLLTGCDDLWSGAQKLQDMGVTLVLVTLGARGAFFKLGSLSGMMPTYDVPTIDTNGAGDAFTGAMHYCLRGKNLADIRQMNKEEICSYIDFANATGSLVTTRNGAIPAMPTLEEIKYCQSHCDHLIKD